MAERRRLTKRDHDHIAEAVTAEWRRRKSRRSEIEAVWDDVDRQVSLVAERANIDANGREMPFTSWMPWLEEAWQATALEVLTDDVLEILLPESGKFFRSVPDINGPLLDRIREEVDTDWYLDPSDTVTSDDVSHIADGVLMHFIRMYDFRGTMQKILVDAMKYGAFAARVRIVNSEGFSGDFRGTFAKKVRFPALIHYPIRNVYLDDNAPSVWASGEEVAPAQIWVTSRKVADLRRVPMADGWIKGKLDEFCDAHEDDEDCVLIEYEGDLVVPRSTVDPVFLPNCIATVAATGSGGGCLVRYQESPYPFRTWLVGSYFSDNLHVGGKPCPYGTSPLLKGRPLQRAGSAFFSRMAHVGLFNAQPPISYNPDIVSYAVSGGPPVFPGAAWPDPDGSIRVHAIGDLNAMAQVWTQIRQAYMEVTGVLPGRISGQTKSHQTTGAVETEQQRSAARTIAFARGMLDGFMRTFLGISFEMAKDCIRGKGEMMFVEGFRDFIRVNARMLPDRCAYHVFGGGAPQEEAVAATRRMNALTLVAKADQAAVAMGHPPLDWTKFRTELLREAGVADPGQYFDDRGASPIDPVTGQPGLLQPSPEAIGPATPSLVPQV